MDSSLSLA